MKLIADEIGYWEQSNAERAFTAEVIRVRTGLTVVGLPTVNSGIPARLSLPDLSKLTPLPPC